MKKKMVSLSLFLISFIITYLIVCFAIPGMRIKLEAAPMEYFVKSIAHMALFKTVVSFVVALILGAMPLIFKKRNNQT